MAQAENTVVIEGDNAVLYCNVTGIPYPAVIWQKVATGEIIVGNYIANITRADAGEYRCTANNTCGEASTVTDITVLCT